MPDFMGDCHLGTGILQRDNAHILPEGKTRDRSLLCSGALPHISRHDTDHHVRAPLVMQPPELLPNPQSAQGSVQIISLVIKIPFTSVIDDPLQVAGAHRIHLFRIFPQILPQGTCLPYLSAVIACDGDHQNLDLPHFLENQLPVQSEFPGEIHPDAVLSRLPGHLL